MALEEAPGQNREETKGEWVGYRSGRSSCEVSSLFRSFLSISRNEANKWNAMIQGPCGLLTAAFALDFFSSTSSFFVPILIKKCRQQPDDDVA